MSYGSSQQQLQNFIQQEQQNAVIRQAINRLSEQCFEMCVDRPGSSLSSSEASCLSQCAARYLDTSQFMVSRMQQKAKQGGH